MSEALVGMFMQFGAAGLIGMLWVVERRHAGVRERQIEETHQALMTKQVALDALLEVVRDNTRAITALTEAMKK